MTSESSGDVPGGPRLLAEITAMLVAVTGEGEEWAARITLSSRLEGDLRLESLEMAALGEMLRAAHGDRVDLSRFFASLDIDQLIGLTVGDLAAYVCAADPAAEVLR